MITLKNIRTLSGFLKEQTFPGEGNPVIDGKNNLLMLPAWIDSDISLGNVQGKSENEWLKMSEEIFQTGATTIIDNSGIACQEAKRLQEYLKTLFRGINLPLRLHSIFESPNPETFTDIGKTKTSTIALKVPVKLLNESATERLFQIAAQENIIVIIPLAECTDPENALNTVSKALELAEKYKTEITFQHVRTKQELTLIAKAKNQEMLVFTEVAYPHLFFTEEDLKKKHLELTNTFLPTEADQEALWKGVNNGIIDMLGSGNHFLPSGTLLPAGKLMLPFMLDACRHEKLSYERLIDLIRISVERIYRLSPTKDVVLVDTENTHPLPVEAAGPSLLSLWSGRPLAGWPTCVIAQGQVYWTQKQHSQV